MVRGGGKNGLNRGLSIGGGGDLGFFLGKGLSKGIV